ncbi:hypothetical protein [Catenovulum sediminis]|uniref:PEP-CTERM protein-sorting domain-containing protein n=1 Tax=Catenovulum sediminis TaxID=1740262 RepID=A0ABV1RC33_9ALTE|nr:hypothetical protein [Catenovulum sediminis]
MKLKHILATLIIGATFNSHAALITVAQDDANNYGNQWLGNGGYGFDEWHFISDASTGNAGGFLANKSANHDVNHIASNPTNNAWGSYANGGGFNQFEAYRGFSNNALDAVGDSFSVAFEHGAITQGGAVGFVLRNQNIHNTIGDYNALSRFEFGFIGGGQHYSIFDGQGVIDTGIDFTENGLRLNLQLLSENIYQLDIFNALDNSLIQSRNGLLGGSGAINSVALYNRDAELANAYFNDLLIAEMAVTDIPEPPPWLLISAALCWLGMRRSNINGIKNYKN